MLYNKNMRTTLELDDDLLDMAKPMARQRGITLGQMISELVRDSLKSTATPKFRNGIRVFPLRAGGQRVDLELVNRLRDEE